MVARLGKLGAEAVAFGLQCGEFVAQCDRGHGHGACGVWDAVGSYMSRSPTHRLPSPPKTFDRAPTLGLMTITSVASQPNAYLFGQISRGSEKRPAPRQHSRQPFAADLTRPRKLERRSAATGSEASAREAAELLRRLLDAGLSEYEPDPPMARLSASRPRRSRSEDAPCPSRFPMPNSQIPLASMVKGSINFTVHQTGVLRTVLSVGPRSGSPGAGLP